MLETVKKTIRKRESRSFDERYIDYIISIQNKNIQLEMDYIRKHNTLDIMKLDKWVSGSLQEAMKI